MKFYRRVLFFVLIIGFTSTQFATLIDDPQHLIEPDPNCPICLTVHTPLCIDQDDTIAFTLDIIYYLCPDSPQDLHAYKHFSEQSIRAPPHN
jgi:hypothetical protein